MQDSKQELEYHTALIFNRWGPFDAYFQRAITLGIGFLSVLGILVYVKANTAKTYQVARGLVTASVVIGVAYLFFFL